MSGKSGTITGVGSLAGTQTSSVLAGSVSITGRGGVYGGSSDPALWSTTPDTQVVNRVGSVISAGPDGAREAYRIVVVKRDGERVAELPDAVVGQIGEELNGVASFPFAMSKRDQAIHHLSVPDTEVQVWRGRLMVGWYVVVRASSNGDMVEFQCKDISWYFTKRFIGKADRTNYITNRSFEQDKANWFWDVNYQRQASEIPAETAVASIVDTQVFTGKKALRLHNTSQAGSTIDYTYAQTFEWTANPSTNPAGEVWTLSAWLYIELFQEPAQNSGGLMLERFSTTEFETHYSPVLGRNIVLNKRLGVANAPIDENTPRNTWIRMEVEIVQPPNVAIAEIIKAKCSGIKGTIYWDEVTLTRKEILGFWNVDQALILEGVVEHSQDVDYAKSDLLIGTDCKLTGVKRTREYIMSEHPLVGETIDEFPTLHNGMDWSIETTATTRTFTSHFPYKGAKRPAVTLELGVNVLSYNLSLDGERTANSVVVLGDGDGSDREEGMYQDKTAFDDGLILEEVYNATPGSQIQTLDDQARRGVERFKHPMKILEMILHESAAPLIPKLRTGDIVRCVIDDGWAQLDEDFRIITKKLNPSTDRLSVTLNPVTEEFPA